MLKDELVRQRRDVTCEQARCEISESIEIFYNRQRRHSQLGNRSPAVFASNGSVNRRRREAVIHGVHY